MKMLHVTVFSECMDESIAFYENIVGLKVVRDLRDNPLHAIVFLANEAGETCVEIVSEPGKAFQGTCISMGFLVEDAEAKRAELDAAGYRPGPMISPGPGTQFFFIKDPNGVDIQFVQEG